MKRLSLARTLLLGLLLLVFSGAGQAASGSAHTPKPGSKERKAVLDALRKPVAKYVKKSVIFTEVDMKVSGNWAYVFAQSVDSKGKPVGDEMTSYVSALLRKSGSSWRPLQWAYATDVISIEWEEKYPRAPKSIWPHRRHSH